MQISQYIA